MSSRDRISADHFYKRTRVSCSATGRLIRDGWALCVSAMDNSLFLDRAVEGDPWMESPLPTDGECTAAYEALRKGGAS